LRAGRRLGRRVGVAWRFGFNNLWRRAAASVGQLTAFGVTLMAMALILLVRTDLLSTWQAQLPDNTPNHFAFNVLADDVPAFERFIGGHRIAAQALYPLVRGRLTAINAAPVTQAVTKEENNNEAINRELNLTWSDKLPPDNQIVSGEWHAPGAGRVVSVEERLARRLGIKTGDALTFSIGGVMLEARVASLRKVQWDSFHPNFYMIFPGGVLDEFPATWLTSFYLVPEQKPLLTELVRRFPSVSVLETDQVLAQVRSILRQVTAAVEFVLLFVLAAGLAVLAAALAASQDERLHEGALLRALGASRRQLRAGHLAEFATLGFAAGLLAAAGTELIAFVLYTRVFELEYTLKWPVWLLAPVAGAVIIAAAGYLGTARVLRLSPLVVLREI
jgi:putative ABC transport system permease protein